jgi:hypothetical protein
MRGGRNLPRVLWRTGALGCQLNVDVFVDVDGVLATKLEDTGREVLGSAFHNDTAHRGTACDWQVENGIVWW